MIPVSAAIAFLTVAVLAQDPPAPAPGGQQPYVPQAGQPAVPPPKPLADSPAQSAAASPAAASSAAPARDEGGLRFRVDLALGGGTLTHDSGSFPAGDDSTGAGYFRLGFEVLGSNDFGGGLRLEGVGSDDDLFGPLAGNRSNATDGQLFLHGTGLFGSEALRLAIRFGLDFRGYRIEQVQTGNHIDWSSFAPRLEFEPEYTLLQRTDLRWSLFGRVGGEAGWTAIDTSPATEDFTSTMTAIDLGIGTRLSFRNFAVDLGIYDRRLWFAESDTVGGLFVADQDVHEAFFAVGLAVMF